MSGEGESDDSTTIRRKILLSPTMPPRHPTDHTDFPLANLIGQVRSAHLTPPLIQNIVPNSVLNETLACDQKSMTSRSTPTSQRCKHNPVVFSSKPADSIYPQKLAVARLAADTRYVHIHLSIRMTDL